MKCFSEGLPELGVWDGVSRRDQHSMVASRKEAKAAKKSKKNEGDACEPKVPCFYLSQVYV